MYRMGQEWVLTFCPLATPSCSSYWWPTLFKDIHDSCKSYDNRKKIRGLKTKSLAN
jgi:hypothetical protein